MSAFYTCGCQTIFLGSLISSRLGWVNSHFKFWKAWHIFYLWKFPIFTKQCTWRFLSGSVAGFFLGLMSIHWLGRRPWLGKRFWGDAKGRWPWASISQHPEGTAPVDSLHYCPVSTLKQDPTFCHISKSKTSSKVVVCKEHFTADSMVWWWLRQILHCRESYKNSINCLSFSLRISLATSPSWGHPSISVSPPT